MQLYHKDTKYGNLWFYWVNHNGFGWKPKLRFKTVENDIYYPISLHWWKLEAYIARNVNKGENNNE